MSEDIVQQARCMVPRDDKRTHHSSCYLVHKDCMLIRLADEVERLREVIRRIAGQDCTVSICRGNVTVTLDATLTEEEREALNNAARWLVAIQSADDPRAGECAATLRGLLQRHGGGA